MPVKKNNQIIKNIIRTLSYSDIFDYPLTVSEIYKYYLGEKTSEVRIYSHILYLIEKGVISKTRNYYCLNGREKIVSERARRERASLQKWDIARYISSFLILIPTVKLVGVSGSLAMNNADKNDDIDLFIITSPNFLWTTRFLVNILLVFKKIKRNRNDSIGKNRICANMFVSEAELRINKNVYTAHEVVQMKVMGEKSGIYNKFLHENSWVKRYIPNVGHTIQAVKVPTPNKTNLIDRIFFKLQYKYMKGRVTNETVSQNQAKFHPKDLSKIVPILYKQKADFYIKYLQDKDIILPQKREVLASKNTPGY